MFVVRKRGAHSQLLATGTCCCRADVERAYLRILSQAIMEHAKNGCADVASAGDGMTGQSLDLSHTGRDFMTAELAQELLAPMLAPGACTAPHSMVT